MTEAFKAALAKVADKWPESCPLPLVQQQRTGDSRLSPSGDFGLVKTVHDLTMQDKPSTVFAVTALRHVSYEASQWRKDRGQSSGVSTSLRVPAEVFLGVAAEVCHSWVEMLVDEHITSKTMYLAEFRSLDDTFYEQTDDPEKPPKLVPKCGATRLQRLLHDQERWPQRPAALPKWLSHPERLTILELELCLVLFDREECGTSIRCARLAPWARLKPGLLRRVHAVLLHRYCFTLLTALSHARRNERLDVPQYRAVEWERFHPRIIGVTGVGYLALVGTDLAPAFLFGVQSRWVVLALIATIVVTLGFLFINVFKENLGGLGSYAQAWPRVLRLFLISVAWSSALGFGVLAAWAALARPETNRFVRYLPDSSPLTNLVVPNVGRFPWVIDFPFSFDRPIRFLALVLSATVIGALLQWFWDDRSALESL